MKSPERKINLKALAWTGFAMIVVVLFVIPKLFSILKVSQEIQQGVPAPQGRSSAGVMETIGELNSTCGGSLRLPCKPGLLCSVTTADTSKTGTCIAAPATASSPLFRQLSESCSKATAPCSDLLYCNVGVGTCMSNDDKAPRVLSIKIDGAQPGAGGYYVKPGAKLSITVQTINADSAYYGLISSEGKIMPYAALMDKKAGGVFTASFLVDPTTDQALIFTAIAKNGDLSSHAVSLERLAE